MKERGLTFTQALAPKVLDGSKTVTRRLGGLKEINQNPDDWTIGWVNPQAKPGEGYWSAIQITTKAQQQIKCPQGVPGDTFYMKEAWGLLYPTRHPMNGRAALVDAWRVTVERSADLPHSVKPLIPVYKADPPVYTEGAQDIRWRSGRFTPRWACRPQRWELVSIRPERVREIEVKDIIAEGVEFKPKFFSFTPASLSIQEAAYKAWRILWDSINAKRGYAFERNPWVWRCEWNPKPVEPCPQEAEGKA